MNTLMYRVDSRYLTIIDRIDMKLKAGNLSNNSCFQGMSKYAVGVFHTYVPVT